MEQCCEMKVDFKLWYRFLLFLIITIIKNTHAGVLSTGYFFADSHWSNLFPILAVSTSLWRILISPILGRPVSVTHLQQPQAIGKITFARCSILSRLRQLSFHLTKFSRNVTPLHRVAHGLYFAFVPRVLNSQIPLDDLLFHRRTKRENADRVLSDLESTTRFNQSDGFMSSCLSGAISETEMYKESRIGLRYSADTNAEWTPLTAGKKTEG